jgi:hypothetical protein
MKSVRVGLIAGVVLVLSLIAGWGGAELSRAADQRRTDRDLLYSYAEAFTRIEQRTNAVIQFVNERIPELQALLAEVDARDNDADDK